MPKLLVVYQVDDRLAESLAESAADGARGVRFMEVDQRVTGGEASRPKPLGPPRNALEYDGIVLVASDRGEAAMTALLGEIGESGATNDVVFAAVGAGAPALLARCARQGGIIAAVRDDGDEAVHAKATGARAAKVVGWVRHALGHEAEHHHAASAGASHKHNHSH